MAAALLGKKQVTKSLAVFRAEHVPVSQPVRQDEANQNGTGQQDMPLFKLCQSCTAATCSCACSVMVAAARSCTVSGAGSRRVDRVSPVDCEKKAAGKGVTRGTHATKM